MLKIAPVTRNNRNDSDNIRTHLEDPEAWSALHSTTAGTWTRRRTDSRSAWGWDPSPTVVTLPHDAMIGGERSPNGSPASAFFLGGVCRYRRTFDASLDDADRCLLLEFEGVYRDALCVRQRRVGSSPSVWLLGVHRSDRPPAAFRGVQRDQSRSVCPAGASLVPGRRYPPQRLVAPGRARPSGASLACK